MTEPAEKPASLRVQTFLIVCIALLPYAAVAIWMAVSALTGQSNFFIIIGQAYAIWTLYLPAWCLVVILILRRRAPKRPSSRLVGRAVYIFLAVGFLSFGARVWATYVEPRLLQVRRVTIHSSKIHQPIRLLHVSDIQSDYIGRYERKVFEKMASLEPDLIVHTGDLLHPVPPATYRSELPEVAKLIANVRPPLGFYNVIGDTDGLTTVEMLTGGPAVGNLRTLHSEDAVLSVGQTRLRLVGLTLSQSRGTHGMKSLVAESIRAGTTKGDFNILMGHAPDYVLHLEGISGIDLCLAGHTHGGQIRVPFYGPIVTFSSVPRDWARGFRKLKDFYLNVSAGIGAEHAVSLPSIRVNCPPEMTLIELLPLR